MGREGRQEGRSVMSPHPLGLDGAQLQVVMEHAKSVPSEWRARYLENVIDQLLPLPVVTTADVQRAAAASAKKMRAPDAA
jgi:hypothetical protein